MGEDERYHIDGLNWYSSCSNVEDLLHWYSKEDAEYLLKHGFRFMKYHVRDYHEFKNETVFLKETASTGLRLIFFPYSTENPKRHSRINETLSDTRIITKACIIADKAEQRR